MNTRAKRMVEFKFGLITWRSYNSIKKKAMEQEFSMSGLIISLSIAFFIVLGSAQALSLTYQGILLEQGKTNIYQNQAESLQEQHYTISYLC